MSQEIMSTRNMLGVAKVFMGIVLSAIFYVLVVIGISKLCDVVYDFSYEVFGDVRVQEAPGFDVEFVVADGESTMQVASRLERSKLITNKYSFYLRAQLTASGKGGTPIKSGNYVLNTSMTYGEILGVITGGEDEEDEATAKG